MDEDMPRSPEYRVVKFSKILSNIGGAYDPENGIFTTPINGTYVIGFTGVSYHGQVDYVDLYFFAFSYLFTKYQVYHFWMIYDKFYL